VNAKIRVSEASDRALYEILNLRTLTAQRIIEKEKALYPTNIYNDFLENWKEVIDLVAFENDKKYDAYLESLDARLKRIDQTMDEDDPSTKILLAEIYAQTGLAQVLFGDYFAGFTSLVKANKNAFQNLEEYPDYWRNYKLCGMLNVAFDKIPTGLKWFTTLLGLKGDADIGFSYLEQYLNIVRDKPGLKSEAMLYYSFALKMSKREEFACVLLGKEVSGEYAPTLLIFILANMMFLNELNDNAYDLLFTNQTDVREVPFYYMDYLKGKVLQYRMDPEAEDYFLDYLKNSTYKNFKKDVSLRLSWFYLLNGDISKYRYYVDRIKTFPKATVERDLEADVESQRTYDPHPELLKARFFSSGGYYNKADSILAGINPDILTNQAFKAEYYLIGARIQSFKTRYWESIKQFEKAIEVGAELNEPFAAKAAYLAGCEAYNYGYNEVAKAFLKLALKIDGQKDVYIDSIHEKSRYMLKMLNY
jgi:hypothetical protein